MANFSAKQLKQALGIRKELDKLDEQRVKLQKKLDKILTKTAQAVEDTVQKAEKTVQKAEHKVQKTKKNVAKKVANVTGIGEARPGSQKAMIREVLATAKKPLSTDQVIAAIQKNGLSTQSNNPKKTIGVLLYTDKAIESAGRGLFQLTEYARELLDAKGQSEKKPATAPQKTKKKTKARKTSAKKTPKAPAFKLGNDLPF